MTRFHSLKAIRSYLGAQARARESSDDSRAPQPPAPFVTISRQAGAGGTSVAVALAGLLNAEKPAVPWTVFDKELVKEVVRQHDLPPGIEKYLTEDSVPELQTIFSEFFGSPTARRGLTAKTSETIFRLALMGSAILVGRAAHIVTWRLPGGFRVRLIASPDRRLDRIREMTGKKPSEVRPLMNRRDRGRRNYVRKYFGADVANPLDYDLLLNTNRLSYAGAAAVIRESMRQRLVGSLDDRRLPRSLLPVGARPESSEARALPDGRISALCPTKLFSRRP